MIENSGISYRQNSQSFIFVCPRCNKKDKLYIRKTDGRFVCFVCAEGEGKFKGKGEFALTELLQLPLGEVQRRLYGESFTGKMIEDLLQLQLYDFYGDDDEIEEDVTGTLPTLLWPLDFFTIDDPRSARGLKYLEEERGIPLALAKTYNLRYCPSQRRVIFPVEVRGRLIGWQARSIMPSGWGEWTDKEGAIHTTPKILGNKGLRREIALMYGDKLNGSEHAVICEGPIDGIKAHLCGGNAVTMGKAVSDAQLKAIAYSGVKRVYLALDPDAAAEMDRICRALGHLELYHLLPLRGRKDLGEMTPEEVLGQFHKAPRIDAGMLFVYLRA